MKYYIKGWLFFTFFLNVFEKFDFQRIKIKVKRKKKQKTILNDVNRI